MPHARPLELAVKLVDADATHPDPPQGEHTPAPPGLRPEVLGDAAQRRTRAMIHAALFKNPGEASTVGPYQILRQLGEGGMGVVYAAYDDQLERKVALKLIRGAAMRRPEGRARTLREARALARLSHPNVVHVYQVGEVDDEIFVAMEFLTGPTLRAWLAARPRTWREVLAVLRQAGEGLSAAHRQGVVHRDFKPANVIVGDDGRVRVLDFGLAHFGDAEEARHLAPAGEVTDVLLTQTGAVLGTPAYMAAEQFAGARGDAKTDQFSFCAVLYEALYGQRPFPGEQLDALATSVQAGQVRPVKARHDVPPWLHRVVMRGLQPDPAARWPSIDALLAALSPPKTQLRGRLAVASGTLLLGGLVYARMATSPPPQDVTPEVSPPPATTFHEQDWQSLVLARASLATDPMMTIRVLASLVGDDPQVWRRAQFLADAATARGLPERVLHAERPLIGVWPLAGDVLVGHDDLGAVWKWKLSDRTATQVLPPGAATQMVVARDVPVWAAIHGRTVAVVGADRDQTIDPGGEIFSDWRLASDGRTLAASAQTTAPTGEWYVTLHLWDLTRPGSPPRTITPSLETFPVLSDDASIVLAREARGIRVIRPQGEKLLRHRGTPRALSADGRFVVAAPDDRDGVLDILEISTGKTRRVEAETVTPLADDHVLFTRTAFGSSHLRRESLATGTVAWRLPLPGPAGSLERPLVVDPAGGRFAAPLAEWWGIGDLERGFLISFLTVPKDSSMRPAGAGAWLAVTDSQVRIYRPSLSPLQVHHDGSGCALAPAGGWALVHPYDFKTGTYTRVDLATRETTQIRCPTRPRTEDRGDAHEYARISSAVDDAGQVAMFAPGGWSCWWDAEHGAREGARSFDRGWPLVALPRGVALAEKAEVEVWTGPDQRTRQWTAAAPLVDMVADPTGARLAVRSEQGVEILHVDSGAATRVPTWSTPSGRSDLLAGTLAWSPDGARLAILDRIAGALELSVWDVTGEPYEVGPADHVTLGGYVLEDSPGRARNRMAFTPAGTSVALTHRHGSLLLVDLAAHTTRRLEVPDLVELHMRSETAAVGIDLFNTPHAIDVAAWDSAPLAPSTELGGSSFPPLRRAADGSLWACAALGPGTLAEIVTPEPSASSLRDRLHELVTSW